MISKSSIQPGGSRQTIDKTTINVLERQRYDDGRCVTSTSPTAAPHQKAASLFSRHAKATPFGDVAQRGRPASTRQTITMTPPGPMANTVRD